MKLIYFTLQGLIKEIHTDVQNGDLEKLKELAIPPIPPSVLGAKDGNGLTPLHKVNIISNYFDTNGYSTGFWAANI